MSVLLVLVTFPDVEIARQVGTALVESQLAACVNLLPGVQSIYRWQGAVEAGAEVLALFKTTSEVLPAFEARLMALHPYEVPEILALKPEHVAPLYAQWVADSVTALPRARP